MSHIAEFELSPNSNTISGNQCSIKYRIMVNDPSFEDVKVSNESNFSEENVVQFNCNNISNPTYYLLKSKSDIKDALESLGELSYKNYNEFIEIIRFLPSSYLPKYIEKSICEFLETVRDTTMWKKLSEKIDISNWSHNNRQYKLSENNDPLVKEYGVLSQEFYPGTLAANINKERQAYRKTKIQMKIEEQSISQMERIANYKKMQSANGGNGSVSNNKGSNKNDKIVTGDSEKENSESESETDSKAKKHRKSNKNDKNNKNVNNAGKNITSKPVIIAIKYSDDEDEFDEKVVESNPFETGKRDKLITNNKDSVFNISAVVNYTRNDYNMEKNDLSNIKTYEIIDYNNRKRHFFNKHMIVTLCKVLKTHKMYNAAYTLFNVMASTYYYSDFAIIVLASYPEFIKKNNEIAAYYLKYVFVTMSKEIRTARTLLNCESRSVFNIEVVKYLPQFNFKTIYNPYVALCSSVDVEEKNLLMGVGLLPSTNTKYHRRICSQAEFDKRFALFTRSCFTDDSGQMFDFKKYNMSVTGSCNVACASVNPLEELFNDSTKSDELNFVDYINYFYPASSVDMDIAWFGSDPVAFQHNAIMVYERVRYNYPNSKLSLVNRKMDTKYEICVIDRSNNVVRNIDLYCINVNIAAHVQKFHFNCVRSWYDGSDVYMLSEAVGALLSGINDSYSYIASNSNPLDCTLKYVSRGFTATLNQKERHCILAYVQDSSWTRRFKDIVDNAPVENIVKLVNDTKVNSVFDKLKHSVLSEDETDSSVTSEDETTSDKSETDAETEESEEKPKKVKKQHKRSFKKANKHNSDNSENEESENSAPKSKKSNKKTPVKNANKAETSKVETEKPLKKMQTIEEMSERVAIKLHHLFGHFTIHHPFFRITEEERNLEKKITTDGNVTNKYNKEFLERIERKFSSSDYYNVVSKKSNKLDIDFVDNYNDTVNNNITVIEYKFGKVLPAKNEDQINALGNIISKYSINERPVTNLSNKSDSTSVEQYDIFSNNNVIINKVDIESYNFKPSTVEDDFPYVEPITLDNVQTDSSCVVDTGITSQYVVVKDRNYTIPTRIAF
jgi:hypothetical protein